MLQEEEEQVFNSYGTADSAGLCHDVISVQVTVAGNSPTAREGHAACILSSFLLISSGLHTSSTGSQRRLADTHILDLATPSWECVDDGAWAASFTFKQISAQYCVFHGNKLYMLKPSKYALCKAAWSWTPAVVVVVGVTYAWHVACKVDFTKCNCNSRSVEPWQKCGSTSCSNVCQFGSLCLQFHD